MNKKIYFLRLDKDKCDFVHNGITLDLIISKFQFWITLSTYKNYWHFRYVWWEWKNRYYKYERKIWCKRDMKFEYGGW